jgi:hypothetical protein
MWRRDGRPQFQRITFLWSDPSVPTTGNLAVKHSEAAKSMDLPDFTGKCGIRKSTAAASRHAYDRIAIGQELWFERLDFDAF